MRRHEVHQMAWSLLLPNVRKMDQGHQGRTVTGERLSDCQSDDGHSDFHVTGALLHRRTDERTVTKMLNESIQRFGLDDWYIPEHDSVQYGVVPLPDGEYVRFADHERDVLFQIKIARDQALCDAIKTVERLYDEWWDVDRRRWLNIVLERLKSLKPQAIEGNKDAE